MADDDWCVIESDPAVFHEIAERLGVEGVQCEEILSIDAEEFAEIGRRFGCIYGLIFLFRWHPELNKVFEATDESWKSVDENDVSQVFFARQVAGNACGTQALLSVLMNMGETSHRFQLGTILEHLKEFGASMDSRLKGLLIASQSDIRSVHNSFKPETSLTVIDRTDKLKEKRDPFHFGTFVPDPTTRSVFYLDGLREKPIRVGSYSNEKEWCEEVISMMMKIIETLQELPALDSSEEGGASSSRFSLIAVVPDRINQLISDLWPLLLREELLSRRQSQRINSEGDTKDSSGVGTSPSDGMSPSPCPLSANEMFELLDESLRSLGLSVKAEWIDPNELNSRMELIWCEICSIVNWETLRSELASLRLTLQSIEEETSNELQKRKLWERENACRHQDWLPVILGLLRHMAEDQTIMEKVCSKQ